MSNPAKRRYVRALPISSRLFNAQSKAFDEGAGDFAPGAPNDPVEGLTRDAHPLGCIHMVETFTVREAQGF